MRERPHFRTQSVLVRVPLRRVQTDACVNRGDGFATAILGLKMFAKVSCDEKESIEEQKCITRSTIVPCAGVNRLTCALCDTYVGGRGFGVYSEIEFMNLRLCENAKEEEVVADFYLTDEKEGIAKPRREVTISSTFLQRLVVYRDVFLVLFLNLSFSTSTTCCPSDLVKTFARKHLAFCCKIVSR